jgi:hypothetical protein
MKQRDPCAGGATSSSLQLAIPQPAHEPQLWPQSAAPQQQDRRLAPAACATEHDVPFSQGQQAPSSTSRHRSLPRSTPGEQEAAINLTCMLIRRRPALFTETEQGRVPHVPVPDTPVPEAPTHEAPDGSLLSTLLSTDWQELLGFGSMTSQDLSCFGEAASMGSLQELAGISIPAVPASQVVNDTPHMHEMPQSVSVFPDADLLRGQEAGETTGERRLTRTRLATSRLFLAATP